MRGDGDTTATLTGIGIAGRADRWDMDLADGRIAGLRPSAKTAGGFLMPLTADVHTHLDKTFTAARMPARATSLFHAIEMMEQDTALWNESDIRSRAETALMRAHLHGTVAMRSHIDWGLKRPPLAWQVLRDLARDWHGRVALQLAALIPLDLFPEIGTDVAREVRAGGGLLGAFIYRNTALAEKVGYLFDLAEKNNLALDFHVDEGLDPDARGIDVVIAETARRGMGGRVLCGHGCSLSVRDPDEVARLLDRAAAAGIGLTVLPGANSYLQDAATGRTPRLRGLAPLQEAQAAGVPVMLGSDNVRDGFFPYGDYDLIEVLRMAVMMGHLAPEDWLDAICTRPARWMGHGLALDEGHPASFIRFDATDLNDVISRPRARREVWRDGAILPEPQGVTP